MKYSTASRHRTTRNSEELLRLARLTERESSRAREHHEIARSAIEKDQEELDRRAGIERARWESKERKLRAAVQRAKQ
jgi:hypothetical protein